MPRTKKTQPAQEAKLDLAVKCFCSDEYLVGYDQCRICLDLAECKRIVQQCAAFSALSALEPFKDANLWRLSMFYHKPAPFTLEDYDDLEGRIQNDEIVAFPDALVPADAGGITYHNISGSTLDINAEDVKWAFSPKHGSDTIETACIPLTLLKEFIAAVNAGMTMKDFDVLAAIAGDRTVVREALESE